MNTQEYYDPAQVEDLSALSSLQKVQVVQHAIDDESKPILLRAICSAVLSKDNCVVSKSFINKYYPMVEQEMVERYLKQVRYCYKTALALAKEFDIWGTKAESELNSKYYLEWKYYLQFIVNATIPGARPDGYKICSAMTVHNYNSSNLNSFFSSSYINEHKFQRILEFFAVCRLLGLDGALCRFYQKKTKRASVMNNGQAESAPPADSSLPPDKEAEIAFDSVPRRTIALSARSVLIREDVFSCTSQEHILEDVLFMVPISSQPGIIEIAMVSGGFCQTCLKNYILEADYVSLKQAGQILCAVVDSKTEREGRGTEEGFDHFNDSSVLYRAGYHVNRHHQLDEATRWTILERLVDSETLTKVEICSYLDKFIKINKNNKRLSAAVEKWEKDRKHIDGYSKQEWPQLMVKTIIR